ncbi:hypothetical protein Barb6_03649 [Bacteroidales bacterium Barb6]|nr:hypothetical protein Barb6_03649 [Bacteroidales bacterium Barb6]
MRPAYFRNLRTLRLHRRAGTHADIHLSGGKFRQRINACLKIVRLPFQYKIKIGSQRNRIESRHEYIPRRICRRSNYIIRTLADKRPKPRRQNSLLHRFRRKRRNRLFPKILIFILRIRRNDNAQHLALLPPVYGSHDTAHRRNKPDFRTVLVCHQYGAGFDPVSCFGNHLREYAVVGIGDDSVSAAPFPCQQYLRRLAFQINIQALLNFNHICHNSAAL